MTGNTGRKPLMWSVSRDKPKLTIMQSKFIHAERAENKSILTSQKRKRLWMVWKCKLTFILFIRSEKEAANDVGVHKTSHSPWATIMLYKDQGQCEPIPKKITAFWNLLDFLSISWYPFLFLLIDVEWISFIFSPTPKRFILRWVGNQRHLILVASWSRHQTRLTVVRKRENS